MTKRIVIYHKADFDGIASAAIFKSKYPDSIFCPYDYGEPFTLPELGIPVYMVDISMPMDAMNEINELSGGQLTWIDHHKSAIDEYYERVAKNHEFDEWFGNLEVGKAACELTWEHLYGMQIPLAIKYLGRYDVWDQSDRLLWEERILPFQWGMRAECNSLETFPMGLLNHKGDSIHKIQEIVMAGKQILEYEKMQNEKMAKSIAFEAMWKRQRCIVINSYGGNSKRFDSVYNPFDHDLMMSVVFNGRTWKVSIYTTHDDIDCSDIAKSMGGGGHRKAAGFNVKKFEDIGLQLR